jgi:hypothetical protein
VLLCCPAAPAAALSLPVLGAAASNRAALRPVATLTSTGSTPCTPLLGLLPPTFVNPSWLCCCSSGCNCCTTACCSCCTSAAPWQAAGSCLAGGGKTQANVSTSLTPARKCPCGSEPRRYTPSSCSLLSPQAAW